MGPASHPHVSHVVAGVARVEYLHVDLGTTTLAQGTTITVAGLPFPPSSTSFENRQDIVRAKLNWHFNFGGEPFAAR